MFTYTELCHRAFFTLGNAVKRHVYCQAFERLKCARFFDETSFRVSLLADSWCLCVPTCPGIPTSQFRIFLYIRIFFCVFLCISVTVRYCGLSNPPFKKQSSLLCQRDCRIFLCWWRHFHPFNRRSYDVLFSQCVTR
jgi:hypothetical protein